MKLEPADSSSLSSKKTTDSDTNTVEISLKKDEIVVEDANYFKEICYNLEKLRKPDCKKRLGLVARVTCNTTDKELAKLLSSGTTTFLFDSFAIPFEKLSALVNRTHAAVDAYQDKQHKKHVIIGYAFEILGDGCRLGRNRYDCSFMLCKGEIITLTTDPAYAYCGYREVCYVANLGYFLERLQLRDAVKIGNDVNGYVVKIMRGCMVVFICKPGIINSFEYITLPNRCKVRLKKTIINMIQDDLEMVEELGGHYIVLHQVRCKLFLTTLRGYMQRNFGTLKVIGSFDYEDVSEEQICHMLPCLDILWVKDYFQLPCLLRARILDWAIPFAKQRYYMPIIGTVPLQCRYQYKDYVNHPFLWLLDAMFIEKSQLCCKYPLIVRQLLTIKNNGRNKAKLVCNIWGLPTMYESRISYIIGAISKVDCRAIFLDINYKAVRHCLPCHSPPSPMYVMLPWDNLNKLSADEDNLHDVLDFARTLNLVRYMRPIVYSNYMNTDNYSPLLYGINYARSKGCIKEGDFIITGELIAADPGTESEEDFVKMRAFFLD